MSPTSVSSCRISPAPNETDEPTSQTDSTEYERVVFMNCSSLAHALHDLHQLTDLLIHVWLRFALKGTGNAHIEVFF